MIKLNLLTLYLIDGTVKLRKFYNTTLKHINIKYNF